MLVIVLCIVNIRIPQLCIMDRNSQCGIIAELFAEENAQGRLWTIEMSPGIQITEIMGGAGRNAKLTLVYNCFILGIHLLKTQHGNEQ